MNATNDLSVLSTNKALTLREGKIAQATFFQRVYRLISKNYASEEDAKVARRALAIFDEMQLEAKEQVYRHIDAFSKNKSRSIQPIRQMQNIATAKKITQALPFLANRELLTEERKETALLTLIRKNFLHRVLPVVDQEHAHSAIIEDSEGNLFIRSASGEDFLSTPERRAYILKSFEDLGLDKLTDEQRLEYASLQGDGAIDASSLRGCYKYLPLDAVAPKDSERQLTGAYWIDGVQEHSSWDFKELRPSMVRYGMPDFNAADYEGRLPQYELRIVTRRPDYSRIGSTLWEFISSLPSISNHGHSYLELVEHEMKDGEYTGRELVYNVGYFLRIVGRLTSNDHTSFAPLSRGGLARERFIVNEGQFKKAKQIIEGIQSIMLQPGHNSRSELSDEFDAGGMRDTINAVYRTVKKGTCLTFTSAVVESATDSQIDRRSWLRRVLLPKQSYAYLDNVYKVFSYIPLVNYLYHGISLVNRGEIPAYAVSNSGDTILDVRS